VRRICLEDRGRPCFMITHDVDEAIYLADRIVLMTNGPGAVFAEMSTTATKERKRTDVHKHPLYYGVRNHIIDFLVSRSKAFAEEIKGSGYDRRPRACGAPGRAGAGDRDRPRPCPHPSLSGVKPGSELIRGRA